MESEFARAWAQLTERMTGPLMLRLILQPMVAATLAVRAGLSDARANRPAYLWTAISNRDARRSLVQSGWRDVGMVFVVACVVDTIYQALELGRFYPLQTLIVACVLAVVPYVLVRGPVTRMARRRRACQ